MLLRCGKSGPLECGSLLLPAHCRLGANGSRSRSVSATDTICGTRGDDSCGTGLDGQKRYERSSALSSRFGDAETYYDHLLGRIISELARNRVGEKAILTAAKLYYEDWTINSIEKLKQADQKYHGRDGYLVCELIRQVTQIRLGELMSEEAKGTAWDKHRIFFVGEYGTTENLMKAMAATLRQAVPQLIDLSPTLTEALTEVEATIQTIGGLTGAMLVRSGCAH